MMWPFKRKLYHHYKIVETISGKFWVEEAVPTPFGLLYHKHKTIFISKDDAQSYIDDRTAKEDTK